MKLLTVALLTILLAGCGSVSPGAGEVAVLVKQPIIFGSGGVDNAIYRTGLHWHAFSTTGFIVKTTPQQITEVFDDLITSDNVPVDFNAYFKYQVVDSAAPILFSNFGGRGWYARNVKERFRTLIRSFAKTQPLFKLTTDEKVIIKMQAKVHKQIKLYVKKRSIPIHVLEVIVGKVSPPAAVVKQTEKTAAQKQRLLTEKQRAKAELSRKEAEQNKALADKAYLVKFGMTVPQYLKLRSLEIEEQRIEMVRHHDNVSIIMGNVTPVLNVK